MHTHASRATLDLVTRYRCAAIIPFNARVAARLRLYIRAGERERFFAPLRVYRATTIA